MDNVVAAINANTVTANRATIGSAQATDGTNGPPTARVEQVVYTATANTYSVGLGRTVGQASTWGGADNGNFVLTELMVKQKAADGMEQLVALANPSASVEQKDFPIVNVIDGDAKGAQAGWAISPKFDAPSYAVFETQADVTLPTGASLILEFSQN